MRARQKEKFMQENPTSPDPREAKKVVETTEPAPATEKVTERTETVVEPAQPSE